LRIFFAFPFLACHFDDSEHIKRKCGAISKPSHPQVLALITAELAELAHHGGAGQHAVDQRW
jgi:hypothetical protein